MENLQSLKKREDYYVGEDERITIMIPVESWKEALSSHLMTQYGSHPTLAQRQAAITYCGQITSWYTCQDPRVVLNRKREYANAR